MEVVLRVTHVWSAPRLCGDGEQPDRDHQPTATGISYLRVSAIATHIRSSSSSGKDAEQCHWSEKPARFVVQGSRASAMRSGGRESRASPRRECCSLSSGVAHLNRQSSFFRNHAHSHFVDGRWRFIFEIIWESLLKAIQFVASWKSTICRLIHQGQLLHGKSYIRTSTGIEVTIL
jgi:hypothetical protein